MRRRLLSVVLGGVTIAACSAPGPEVSRVRARPGAPTVAIQPGEHPLGLGGRRDGTLYVPAAAASGTPLPLIVLLHGGGGRKEFFRPTFPLAEDIGAAILALDSRDNTWDAVDGRIGPDVRFIDAALHYTFDRIVVDPRRIALGGISDGASYALSLGLANGDLFTHLAAIAPGFIARPAPPVGRPRIFVAHGTLDNVLNIDWTSRRFVPQLRRAGYEVTYQEFEGAHNLPPAIAREMLEWFVR